MAKKKIQLNINAEELKKKLKIVDGVDGQDGVNGKDGINGLDGISGKDGKDGKDGSPDTPDEVIEKIHKSKKLIKKEKIEGLDELERKTDFALSRPILSGNMGGGTNLTVTEDGQTRRQSVTKIDFGAGIDVTPTTNGVRITLDSFEKNVSYNYKAVSSDYVIESLDYTIDCTGNISVTLPTASLSGRIIVVKNSGVKNINVLTTSSELIDGHLTQELNPKDALMVQSTGSSWIII